MSIDWLLDLERDVENGKEIFGAPSPSRNQWVIGRPLDELKRVAKRSADAKKLAVSIIRVVSKHDTIAGDMYLVPTSIGEPGPKGEPNISWAIVDTKEAAEMMRDVKRGPSPFFGMQITETVDPTAA